MCAKIECIEKNNNSVKVKLKKYHELYYNFNFNRGKSETEFFMLCINLIYKNLKYREKINLKDIVSLTVILITSMW